MASFRQSLRELLRWFSAVDPSTERSTRGMRLLTGNLSLAQRKQYAMHGYFDVTGSDTGKSASKGKEVIEKYLWTDVFVRRNGRWQAVASQSTKVVR